MSENRWAIGDFQAIRRDLFDKIGGFDERFTGWGYADYDLAIRCADIIGDESLMRLVTKRRVLHLYHERLPDMELSESCYKNRTLAGNYRQLNWSKV